MSDVKYLDGDSLVLARHLIQELRNVSRLPDHTRRFLTSIENQIKSKDKISERQLDSLKLTYERYTS